VLLYLPQLPLITKGKTKKSTTAITTSATPKPPYLITLLNSNKLCEQNVVRVDDLHCSLLGQCQTYLLRGKHVARLEDLSKARLL
jgi:hypothetical protein